MSKKVSLIEDFIYPSLENKTFGKSLEWENRKKGIFQMYWPHKSGRRWTELDFSVFKAWDEMKGNFNPNKDGYWTNSKGRMRSAFCRLKSKVEVLRKPYKDVPYRRYKLKHMKELQLLPVTRNISITDASSTPEYCDTTIVNYEPQLSYLSSLTYLKNDNVNESNSNYLNDLTYKFIDKFNYQEWNTSTESDNNVWLKNVPEWDTSNEIDNTEWKCNYEGIPLFNDIQGQSCEGTDLMQGISEYQNLQQLNPSFLTGECRPITELLTDEYMPVTELPPLIGTERTIELNPQELLDQTIKQEPNDEGTSSMTLSLDFVNFSD